MGMCLCEEDGIFRKGECFREGFVRIPLFELEGGQAIGKLRDICLRDILIRILN